MFHTVQLSKSDPTPLYIQLACELSKLIQDHYLKEGLKLPTIRHLSKQLSINRDTVVSAYKLLESQGLVESYIGKGTYICTQPVSTSPPPVTETNTQICCSHIGIPKDFFPDSLCLDLTTKIVKKEGWEAFVDPLYRERHLLKHAISDFLNPLGIPHHYAQVRVIKTMDEFLLDLFKISPKKGICVESIRDLSWSCYLRCLGAKIYEVPLTSEGLDLTVLEKHLHTGNIAYIFISSLLQNPSGICYSGSCRKNLLSLARQYDCTIIDDLTYASFMYEDPLPTFPKEAPVIYIYQFSKLYLSSLNYTFAILPLDFIKRLRDTTECSFNERFLCQYLKSSELKTIQETLYYTFKERYFFLYDALSKLPLRLSSTHGGLSFWLRVPLKQYDAFCNNLLAKGIIVSPGEIFTTKTLKGYVRLSFTHLDANTLPLVVRELTLFFQNQRSSPSLNKDAL